MIIHELKPLETKEPDCMDTAKPALLRRGRKHLDLFIYPNGNPYPIEYSRMDTPEKVLAWVYHLLKKRRVTKEHLRAFLEVARERGVNVNLHG